jgi:hypothetical protein
MSQAGAGANHDQAQNQTPKAPMIVIVNKMSKTHQYHGTSLQTDW